MASNQDAHQQGTKTADSRSGFRHSTDLFDWTQPKRPPKDHDFAEWGFASPLGSHRHWGPNSFAGCRRKVAVRGFRGWSALVVCPERFFRTLNRHTPEDRRDRFRKIVIVRIHSLIQYPLADPNARIDPHQWYLFAIRRHSAFASEEADDRAEGNRGVKERIARSLSPPPPGHEPPVEGPQLPTIRKEDFFVLSYDEWGMVTPPKGRVPYYDGNPHIASGGQDFSDSDSPSPPDVHSAGEGSWSATPEVLDGFELPFADIDGNPIGPGIDDHALPSMDIDGNPIGIADLAPEHAMPGMPIDAGPVHNANPPAEHLVGDPDLKPLDVDSLDVDAAIAAFGPTVVHSPTTFGTGPAYPHTLIPEQPSSGPFAMPVAGPDGQPLADIGQSTGGMAPFGGFTGYPEQQSFAAPTAATGAPFSAAGPAQFVSGQPAGFEVLSPANVIGTGPTPQQLQSPGTFVGPSRSHLFRGDRPSPYPTSSPSARYQSNSLPTSAGPVTPQDGSSVAVAPGQNPAQGIMANAGFATTFAPNLSAGQATWESYDHMDRPFEPGVGGFGCPGPGASLIVSAASNSTGQPVPAPSTSTGQPVVAASASTAQPLAAADGVHDDFANLGGQTAAMPSTPEAALAFGARPGSVDMQLHNWASDFAATPDASTFFANGNWSL